MTASRDHWPETFGEQTVLESEFEVPSVCENTKNECRFQFLCSVSSEMEMSVLPLEEDVFVLAPIRRIVWTSDQTEFVVYFPCVVSVHAQFMTTCMAQDQDSKIVSPTQNKSHRHVTHVCTCAFLLLSLYTFNTHTFFLDPFIKNNLSGHVADR